MAASVGDIFENLNMALMFAAELRYKKFGIAFDFLTLSMGIEGSRPVTGHPVKASSNQQKTISLNVKSISYH